MKWSDFLADREERAVAVVDEAQAVVEAVVVEAAAEVVAEAVAVTVDAAPDPQRSAGGFVFEVDAAVLRKALGRCKPATARAGAHPVLGGVRFVSGPSGTTVEATDLDVKVVVQLDTTPAPEAVSVVNLGQLAKQLVGRKDTVTLRSSGGWLGVEAAGMRAMVRELPAEDYPKANFDQGYPSVAHNFDLAAFLDVVRFGSVDQARPILCTVAVDGADHVATDSYRLGLLRSEHPWSGPPMLVPGGLVKLLGRGDVERNAATVFVTPDKFKRAVAMTMSLSEGVTVSVRLVEGEFIRYQQLMPEPGDGLTWARPAVDAAVKQLAAAPFGAQVPVCIKPVDGALELSRSHVDEGSMSVTVAGSSNFESLSFNAGYLASILEGSSTEQLTVSDPHKPALLAETVPGLGERRRIIMPVRL